MMEETSRPSKLEKIENKIDRFNYEIGQEMDINRKADKGSKNC